MQEYDPKIFTKMWKRNPNDKIWHMRKKNGEIGKFYFSFDQKTVYQYFGDYPKNMTKEQIEIYDEECGMDCDDE